MTVKPDQLLAVTPLDGRYADKVAPLSNILSEHGLIRRRAEVELGWLSTLGSGVLPDVEPFGGEAQAYLKAIAEDFSVEDSQAVKDHEAKTNHDVKAVENWLRGKLGGVEPFNRHLELIHFGATSEDINNLAYGLQLSDTRNDVILPGLNEIAAKLEDKAYRYADVAMLSRTHGQPATPNTLGKEMRVFSVRVRAGMKRIGSVAMFGKFNGATGNWAAMRVAYPEVDWPVVTDRFVRSFGFEVSPATTQIEPHDWTAALLNEVALSNTVLTDLARDMWAYISMGYFSQEVKAGEVGSSTMPHKVNPIDFENAEANFGLANAVLTHLATKLPISRLQRDLSDSSAQRGYGEAFGHTYVAHQSLRKGLDKVHADESKIALDLDDATEVLTEAVQTVMRRYDVPGAYELIKNASRGRALTREDYLKLVGSLDIPDAAKKSLQKLTPGTYTGYAADIARDYM